MSTLSDTIIEANVNAQILFGIFVIGFLLLYIFFGPERKPTKQKH